jgi:tyrosine-protein phosphatase OCA1
LQRALSRMQAISCTFPPSIASSGTSRSGQPVDLNYPFLEKLNVKQILYFSPEPPPPSFQSFIHDQGIELLQLGGAGDEKSALWSPMSEEVVLQALKQILDVPSPPSLLPLS